jgi:hypothetical protein
VSVLPIVLIVAAVAILGGVIVVAMGRGGELAPSGADVRPLDTDIVTAADVALLRPPAALWGYDMRATDEALNQVARTVTERDVEIADLRRQLADMQPAPPSPWEAPREAPQDAPPPPREAPPPPAPQEAPQAPRGTRNPRHAAGPAARPFRRAVGGPTRPPGDEQSWSAWERPGAETETGPGQEPDDYPETGTATGARG